MKSSRYLPAFTLAAALAVGTLAACGGGDDSSDSDGTVDLKVAIDAGLEQAAIDAFNERIAQFEDANPDINVETQEYTWTATTFTAELAGDTLPDVFTVPFTDGRGLIEREQIADISDLVAELPYADKFNPKIAEAGQAADGGIWAVPISAYGQGLHYNRTLFTAGRPRPRLASDDVGGGPHRGQADRRQDRQGRLRADDQRQHRRLDPDHARQRLRWHAPKRSTATRRPPRSTRPRWQRCSTPCAPCAGKTTRMGANFLYDWGTINQAFAAGQIGMYVSGGGNYGNLKTQNGLNPDDYGVTVIPLADNADAGTLGGGTLAVVRAKADDVTKEAARSSGSTSTTCRSSPTEDAAKLDAEARADSGAPVGDAGAARCSTRRPTRSAWAGCPSTSTCRWSR